jgi:hypothetical protein
MAGVEKINRSRPYAALLAVFCAALMFASGAQAADARDCRLSLYAEVDIAVDDDDAIIVPITLAGKATKAILNLSSLYNSVGPSTVAGLSLATKPLPADPPFMVGGLRLTKYILADIVIDNLRLNGGQLLVTTDPGADVSARLGMNLFDKVDFELNFAAGKLRLFSQDHCPGQVVYWSRTHAAVPIRRGSLGEAYLVMELEGRKIEAMIATGAPTTGLHRAAAEKLFGIQVEAGREPQRQEFMDLTAGGLAVMNAQVDILGTVPPRCRLRERIRQDGAAGYDGCYNIFPLMLGMNILRTMRMYFATRENVLYFTPADAHK